MQIEVTGHQFQVTDALRRHIDKRVARLADCLQTPPPHVNVVLAVVKNLHRCDLQVRFDDRHVLACSRKPDMYAAIDDAADKLLRQIKNIKGRRLNRRDGA